LYFHPDAGGLGLLGSGYRLAAFLSSLDVHRHHPPEFSADPLGIFHRVSAAGLWDYTNIFATTFLYNGMEQLSRWIYTGHLQRPDLLIAIPAWISNLLVVIGCIWGYCRLPGRSWGDSLRFVITFALTTAFFALDMYLFQTRYLGIFPRLLHPRLP
jgi:hypothetical protein